MTFHSSRHPIPKSRLQLNSEPTSAPAPLFAPGAPWSSVRFLQRSEDAPQRMRRFKRLKGVGWAHIPGWSPGPISSDDRWYSNPLASTHPNHLTETVSGGKPGAHSGINPFCLTPTHWEHKARCCPYLLSGFQFRCHATANSGNNLGFIGFIMFHRFM